MRHLIAAFLLLAVPFAAHAEARKYAVLSLIGDRLLIAQDKVETLEQMLRYQTQRVVPELLK